MREATDETRALQYEEHEVGRLVKSYDNLTEPDDTIGARHTTPGSSNLMGCLTQSSCWFPT